MKQSHPLPPFQGLADCPVALFTGEHALLFDALRAERQGLHLYPTLLDYPVRLARQLDVLRSCGGGHA